MNNKSTDKPLKALSKQEKQQLAYELNKGSAQQIVFLYSGIIIVVIIALLLAKFL